jgi:hypothetical protein
VAFSQIPSKASSSESGQLRPRIAQLFQSNCNTGVNFRARIHFYGANRLTLLKNSTRLSIIGEWTGKAAPEPLSAAN